MKNFLWGWLIIRSVFTVLIAFFIFGVASDNFQIVTLSLLLIIYTESTGSLSGWFQSERNDTDLKRYIHLLEVLKDPALNEPDVQWQIGKAKGHFKNLDIQYMVSNLRDLIIFVIAAWNLILAI